MEKLLDAADRISEQEDMIGKLKSELFLAREEIARRPCIAYDAPRDLKDEKIASMEKTLREYEVIFANTDAEEAAARERKLVEREYRDRLQTLERDKHARIATEGKLTELLASERRVGSSSVSLEVAFDVSSSAASTWKNSSSLIS